MRGSETERGKEHVTCYSLSLFTAADTQRPESSAWSWAMHTQLDTDTHILCNPWGQSCFLSYGKRPTRDISIYHTAHLLFKVNAVFHFNIQIINNNKPQDRTSANNCILALWKCINRKQKGSQERYSTEGLDYGKHTDSTSSYFHNGYRC